MRKRRGEGKKDQKRKGEEAEPKRKRPLRPGEFQQR